MFSLAAVRLHFCDTPMNRRDLLRLAPAAALLASETASGQQQQQAAPGPQFTREQLRQALALAGLDFKDEQLDLMLPSVSRGVNGYAELRKIAVPLDTDPAFRFDPLFAGKAMPAAGKFKASKQTGVEFKDIDDLAYAPVTRLADLVRRKRVTSTQLTKMYLERLKKHSPTLLCTIALTEALALEQAARADAEIRRGKYKGPLHGIPYGEIGRASCRERV